LLKIRRVCANRRKGHRRSAIKRIVKIAAGILLLLLAIPVLALFGIYCCYISVVLPKPGALAAPVSPPALAANVDPFIGTGGYFWMSPYNTPAVTAPFGMMRLGPDTASLFINRPGLNTSGYFYSDNKIIGFSHCRLIGTGTRDGRYVTLFPAIGTGAEKARRADRCVRFSHRHETAFPGYYAVELPKPGVLAELTASARAGIHRYTFRKEETPHLILDAGTAMADGRTENGRIQILPDAREVEGSLRGHAGFANRYGGLNVYFVAQFSEPFTEYGTWSGPSRALEPTYTPGAASAVGDGVGADLAFAKSPGQPLTVEVRVGISFTSLANARVNLAAEAAGKDFNTLATETGQEWESRLGRIRIQGGTERQRRIFYTALYRAFQMPTVFNDVNGEYIGFDLATHKAEGFRYFTDFSLWDTFRTAHPLYNLIARADARDMMVSLVEMTKAGGSLPRWPAGYGYSGSMLGTPADVAVTEAYLKGIRDFDVETAYKSMRQNALEGPPPGCKFGGRDGLEWYLAQGYCPSEKMREAVAATLEYSHEDYAISLLAKELGHTEDAETFARHSQYYRNLWNPGTQYFMPKDSSGSWQAEFKPLLLTYMDFEGKYTNDYVEGSALQWRWYVPFDGAGLVSLFESPEYFASQLDDFFAKSNKRMGQWNPGPYYWHGNQPDIHAVYLFNAANRPDLTQKWVRWILETRYDDNYVGLDGNDDGGTLSAWYVLSAMGFYPVAGTARYELGAPLFEKAEMNLGDGKILTVIAQNHAPENTYVRRVILNGTTLERTWFSHEEIANGGTLVFEMVPAP